MAEIRLVMDLVSDAHREQARAALAGDDPDKASPHYWLGVLSATLPADDREHNQLLYAVMEQLVIKGMMSSPRIDVATASCAPLAQAMAAATQRLADLVTHQEQRIDLAAEKLAAPLVKAAKRAADERVAAAEYATRRQGELLAEVRRIADANLAARDRMIQERDEAMRARDQIRAHLARLDIAANVDRAARNEMQQQRDAALAEVERLRAAAGETASDTAWDDLGQVLTPIVAGELARQAEEETGPEFPLDAALADGGSVTITYHAGEEPPRFVARVADIETEWIGHGSSTTSALDALRQLSEVRPIEVVDEMPF